MSSNMSSGKPAKAENKGMQCNSTTKSGSQCKLAHMDGSTRCPVHQSGMVVANVEVKSPLRSSRLTLLTPSARVVKLVDAAAGTKDARIDTLKARHTLLRTQFDLVADEMHQIDNEIQSLERVAVGGRPPKAATSKERCTAHTQEKTQCKLAKSGASDYCSVHNH